MYPLGKLYIVLSDETERTLPLTVVTVFGGKKGNLSDAIEAVIKEWLDKHATEADITKWVRDQLHEKGRENLVPPNDLCRACTSDIESRIQLARLNIYGP